MIEHQIQIVSETEIPLTIENGPCQYKNGDLVTTNFHKRLDNHKCIRKIINIYKSESCESGYMLLTKPYEFCPNCGLSSTPLIDDPLDSNWFKRAKTPKQKKEILKHVHCQIINCAYNKEKECVFSSDINLIVDNNVLKCKQYINTDNICV